MGKPKTETDAPAQTPATPRGEFTWLRPSELVPSDNPRRTPYPAEAFENLVQSVRTRGVLEPLIVRRLLEGIGYQVVAGDTRRLAALKAGLEEVPCVVLVLDDVEMLEIQLIENIQRQDMHPLDEGEGFARLVAGGRSAESIAHKVSKSVRWVQQRIAFSKLIPSAKTAFLEGKFTASHAELLVRLDAQAQASALAFVLEVGPGYQVSVDELSDWVHHSGRLDVESPVVHAMFPELASAHEDAEADGAKLLQLSTTYGNLPIGVLGQKLWTLATGKQQCALSERGVIVLGDNQGQVVTICRNKACAKHWPVADVAETSSRSATKGKDDAARRRDDAKRARQAERQERTEKLMKAARPHMIKHLVGLAVVPVALVRRGLDDALRYINQPKEVAKALGTDPIKDVPRALAVGVLMKSWISPDDFDAFVAALKFDLSPFDPDAPKPVAPKAKAAARAKGGTSKHVWNPKWLQREEARKKRLAKKATKAKPAKGKKR